MATPRPASADDSRPASASANARTASTPSGPRSSTSSTCRVPAGTVIGLRPASPDSGQRRPTEPADASWSASTGARMSTARSISASLTSRDGANRSTSGRGALTTRPASSSRPAGGRGDIGGEHGGQQQTLAPDRGNPGRAGQTCAQPGPGRPGPGRDVLRLHHGQGGPGRGHGQRLATEGAAVVTWHEGRGHLGPRPARPHRHPVAQGLGHGHHVGYEAEVLEPEPPPGAPEPGLDLVHHRAGCPRSVHSWRRPPR